MAPALPAYAANGTLAVSVRVTDTAGNDLTVVDASKTDTYRVRITYSCNVAQCDNTQVKLAGMPADPYYGTDYKEQSYSFTPPSGITPTPTASGSIAAGFSVPLGNLTSGTGGSMSFDFNVGARRAGVIAGNFFPDGSPINPQATATSSTAATVTGSASATWKSYLPTPTLSLTPSQTSINTDTTLTLTARLASGCFVGASIPYYLCGDSARVTVDLPTGASYVSGGSYDAGTNSVTLSAGPKAWNTVAPSFTVTFPSGSMPTTSPGCVATRTFTARDATYTYLDGTAKSTNPATSPATVTVGNCAPFAKGSLRKFAAIRGVPSAQTEFPIPTSAAGNYDMNWIVSASNQSNVPAVATIVDDALDLPDLAVHTVQTGDGSPAASIQYTVKDDATGVLTTSSATNQATVVAPAGTHIVSAKVVSPTLAAPNVQETDTKSTPFSVRYIAAVTSGATPGRSVTNTASATLTFPSNPELGTYTPAESPVSATVTLVNSATPLTLSANALTATAPGGNTPIVGTQVTWTGNGTASNLKASSSWTPQYVFLAPLGWTIDSNGASLSTPVPGMAPPTYKTVTYNGQTYDAVVLDWPGPVTGTGSYTLPTLSVKTRPTGAATAGTDNQIAYLLVGDAGNLIADAYAHGSGGYIDATDIDGDGSTTDRFDRGSGTSSLGSSPGIDVKKYICQPNAAASDGCTWIADPSVTVGVPPDATSIKYKVTITNSGNAPLSDVAAYDVLPYLGDVGTSDATASTPRGSTVQEQLSAVANTSADVSLAYSTSTNPPRPEVYGGSATGDWSAPLAGAAAIRATIPTLAPGGSRSFTYTAALVGASADQIACNSVAAAGAGIKVEPSPVCATTQQADFGIRSSDRLPLQAGRVGVVPFVVNNGGGSALATATVAIEVPAEVSIASFTPSGWDCAAPSTRGPVEVTCTPVNADGTSRSLAKDVPETLALRVTPSASASGQLCFDAVVTGLMSDPNPDNDTATSCSTTVVAQPELVVTKDDAKESVKVGETYTYTLTAFSRLVAESVDGVTLTDTLPDSLELVSASPAPTAQSGQQLSWDLGALAQAGVPGSSGDLATGGAGSSKTVTVTVRVKAGVKNTITNTAEAAGADPADAALTLSASGADVDVVRNVFTDLGAAVSTPQNQPVTTDLADIASAAGAALDPAATAQAIAPQHGSLTIDGATGAVTYAPAAGYTGADSYVVQVCDTSAPVQCSTATVSVQVGANVVTAVDDTASTDAAVAVTTDVRGNDTSASGQALASPTVAAGPAHGTTGVNADGSITYTPGVGFSGVDSYTYRVCDTSHPDPVCDSATVTVRVANGWALSGVVVETPHNSPVTTPLADLVTTTGAALDPATVVQVSAPAHGSLAIDAGSGAVTYTPEPGYAGADAYTVSVCDTSTPVAECRQVPVPVRVLANSVAAPDLAIQTRAGQSSDPVDLVGATVSGSGQPLDAATITTGPEHGAVVIDADGAATYTPEAGYDGADSFVYQVCDTSHPTPVCDTGTVRVTVSPVADLAVTKTLTTPQVVAGLQVRYDVALTNHGPSTAEEVHSIDPVPATVTDPTGTADPAISGASCTTRATTQADLNRLDPAYGPYTLASHPRVVDCTYPELPAGTTVHDTLTGTVDAGMSVAGRLVNEAVAYATTYDPDLGDNRSTVRTDVHAVANLAVTKKADRTRVARGEKVTFTVTVVNRGPSVATGVEVTDTPSGMRLVAVGQTAGSFANGLWRIGRLEVGESVTLTGDYKVTAQQAGNSAVARGEVSDPVSADNAARVTLRVGAAHASGGDHHHGNGGGGAGGGGGLPLADTGNPVDRAVLGLGLMLVLAGGLVLVGRRRRARS